MSAPPAVEIAVPGDKSISHRALILGSLADGTSRVRGLLDAADTRSTAAALRALGAEIAAEPGEVTIQGAGLRGWTRPAGELDCGNSGTTARLLLGALAGCPFEAMVTGDASLRARPMRRVTDPLARAGAAFQEMADADRLPVRVRGRRPLEALDVENPRSSAQVKTAMLLAGLTAGSPITVSEPGRSRDHSERMLEAMGARVSVREVGRGAVVALDIVERLDPLDLRVPGDFSSAAFFLALGALAGPVRVTGVGLNPTRTGALDVLRRMGVPVVVHDVADAAGEPVGSVMASPGELRGTTVAPDEVPTLLDEIPILAALAARAAGETRFEGIGELRVKESDRVQGMVDNLRALGVDAQAGPDWLTVAGDNGPLRGEVEARGDHRLAMAFGVLGALPAHHITVRGGDVVEISYPAFWRDLARVSQDLEA